MGSAWTSEKLGPPLLAVLWIALWGLWLLPSRRMGLSTVLRTLCALLVWHLSGVWRSVHESSRHWNRDSLHRFTLKPHVSRHCSRRLSICPAVHMGLDGVDFPEKRQAFGTKAKQAASTLVFGKEVTLHTLGLDKYGPRLLMCSCRTEPTSITRWSKKAAPLFLPLLRGKYPLCDRAVCACLSLSEIR